MIFELERVGRQPGRPQRIVDVGEQASSRDWLGNRLTPMRPSGSPAARHAAVFSQAVRMIQRPTSGAIELAASVSMKAPGRDQAAHRMPPAQQRLGADHGFVGEPDLRLEVQLELVLGEGAPQLEIEAAPRLRLRAQHRQEEAIGAAAVGLRLVEREVGVGDQLVDRCAPSLGAMAMPALPPICSTCSLTSNGSASRLSIVSTISADHARVAAIGHDDDELVAAEPAHLVAAAGDVAQALADLDQQLVAGRMAERVVDVLEAVEIEQRDRTSAAAVAGQQPPSSFCKVRRLGSPVSWS